MLSMLSRPRTQPTPPAHAKTSTCSRTQAHRCSPVHKDAHESQIHDTHAHTCTRTKAQKHAHALPTKTFGGPAQPRRRSPLPPLNPDCSLPRRLSLPTPTPSSRAFLQKLEEPSFMPWTSFSNTRTPPPPQSRTGRWRARSARPCARGPGTGRGSSPGPCAWGSPAPRATPRCPH